MISSMNKIIFVAILLFVIPTYSFSQKTQYYKLVRIIENNVSITDTEGGQFLTFIDDICYESDNKGLGVGHGILRLNKNYSNSSFKIYIGSSYWGNAVTFKFKSDLSVLNVVTDEGDVYVYKRQTAPINVATCSLIRKSKIKGNNDCSPLVQPIYGSTNGQSISNNNSNTNSVSTNIPVIKSREPKKCGACNGRGWVPETKGVASLGQPDKWCNECNKTVPANHYHTTCPSCKGKGYW